MQREVRITPCTWQGGFACRPAYDGRSPLPDADAEQCLARFHEEQLDKSRRERARFERASVIQPAARWNRQELHIDAGQRANALAASRRYLARHRCWWKGRGRLDERALRAIVAAQHFFEVDLQDLTLPEEQRRSEDTFGRPDTEYAHVCEQFLLDAPRGAYVIDGQLFEYSKEVAGDLEALSGAEVARRQRAFTQRVVDAVRGSIAGGADADPLVLKAVTTFLSQSGMASVERACQSSQVAVGGGEQEVKYKLFTHRCGPVHSNGVADNTGKDCLSDAVHGVVPGGPSAVYEIHLSVRKVRFSHCFIFDGDTEAGPTPIECGPGSSVGKSCRIQVRPGAAGDSLEVEVVDLAEELRLFDEFGRILELPWEKRRPPRWKMCFGALGRCCGEFCHKLRLRLRRRRYRPKRDEDTEHLA